MQEYIINEYIKLKLENVSLTTRFTKRTIIYVMGKPFLSCKYLLLNIPYSSTWEYDHYKSMDEIIEDTAKSETERKVDTELISPEEEFQGHCSNIQAWVENNYDYRLLDTRLSIPIISKILQALKRRDDKTEFMNFFTQVVPTLDQYIMDVRVGAIFYDKVKFLTDMVYPTGKVFTKEQIEGSLMLKHLYDRMVELELQKIEKARIKREKKLARNRFLSWERKIWGTENPERFLSRKIRNRERSTIVSDELDYLPYLYAVGKFTNADKLSYYTYSRDQIILRDDGEYYLVQSSRGDRY